MWLVSIMTALSWKCKLYLNVVLFKCIVNVLLERNVTFLHLVIHQNWLHPKKFLHLHQEMGPFSMYFSRILCYSHAALEFDHDKQIQKKFWGYIKTYFKESTSLPKSFNVYPLLPQILCFQKSIEVFQNTRVDSISQPTFFIIWFFSTFILTDSKVIQRIKAAGSSCPLDKISIILFKWYPYLRS